MSSTILVCDDEDVLRRLIRAGLERRARAQERGYEISEARDGEEALALARQLRPDLVILDLMMPGRSGLDVLEELRSDPDLLATPVIVLTGRAQTEDREAVERAGADRYLTKPFLIPELTAAVDELLGG